MATYPPVLPPANRTDSTVSATNHAADHNKLTVALATILEALGADPAGSYADLTSRLVDIPSSLEIPDKVAEVIAARTGVVFLETYPRTGGETDDSPRLARALTAAATLGAKVVELAAKTYTWASQVNVTQAGISIRGAGKSATTVNVTADVIALNITGHNVTIEDMTITCTTAARTVYPVKFTNTNQPVVQRCQLRGIDGSRRAGVYIAGASGSMGTIRDSIFSHACIRVEVWDVKIIDCYVWGMSCDFCIGIYNGAGNTTVINTDIVPPFVSNANGIAGIFVDGVSGKAFNTKLIGIYLDGNPSLNLRQGIYLGEGTGATLIQGCNANKMDSDCIVIDSAYNVLIDGYTGHGNNQQGNGAREIVVKQTGSQVVEGVRIVNFQALQTVAVAGGGVAGPAIEVMSPVSSSQVVIHEFDIKQPSAGGGYVVPELKVPVTSGYPNVSMFGKGQLSKYQANGTIAVASGATGATIDLSAPYPMAYRPRPEDIRLATTGAPLPAYRIQYTTDNRIFVSFASAISGAADLFWRVDLRR